MLKRINYLLIVLIIPISIYSQEINVKKTFRDAIYYLETGQFNLAVEKAELLYKSDPFNTNFIYLLGKSYFNINRLKKNALPYLQKAIEEIDPNYDSEDYESKSAGADTWLMLGELSHLNGDLDSAMYFYKQFQNIAKTRDEQIKVTNNLRSIKNAQTLQRYPLPYSPQNLGPRVNTHHSDYSPVLSKDEETLAYTSLQNGSEYIFLSRKVNGNWNQALDITKDIGSNGSSYTAALSSDGNRLYLININDLGSDVYVSEYSGDNWSKMKLLDSRINSNYYETSLCINKEGNEIIFSSDLPDSYGGLDLYYSKLDEKGKWSNPVNLGAKINTPQDEEFPHFARNGELLFFSSNGHENMGGFDLFFSEKVDNNKWSNPINLGYPINTTDNDLSFVAMDQGNRAYIVKDLPNGFGLVDIYEVEIPKNLLFANKLSELPKNLQYAFNASSTSNMETAQMIKPTEPELKSEPISENIESTIPENKQMDKTAINTTQIAAPSNNIKSGGDYESNPIPPIAERETSTPIKNASHSSKTTNEADKAYTIQIIALKNAVPIYKFSKAGNVKQIDGNDNFTRYTIGYFKDIFQAQNELVRIHSIGYGNAFIRDVRSVSNYFK